MFLSAPDFGLGKLCVFHPKISSAAVEGAEGESNATTIAEDEIQKNEPQIQLKTADPPRN